MTLPLARPVCPGPPLRHLHTLTGGCAPLLLRVTTPRAALLIHQTRMSSRGPQAAAPLLLRMFGGRTRRGRQGSLLLHAEHVMKSGLVEEPLWLDALRKCAPCRAERRRHRWTDARVCLPLAPPGRLRPSSPTTGRGRRRSCTRRCGNAAGRVPGCFAWLLLTTTRPSVFLRTSSSPRTTAATRTPASCPLSASPCGERGRLFTCDSRASLPCAAC